VSERVSEANGTSAGRESDNGGVKSGLSRGLADADRIGIVGFSRSCYYVLEALTAGSLRFRTASITHRAARSTSRGKCSAIEALREVLRAKR